MLITGPPLTISILINYLPESEVNVHILETIKQYVHLFKQRDLVVKQTFHKCLRT